MHDNNWFWERVNHLRCLTEFFRSMTLGCCGCLGHVSFSLTSIPVSTFITAPLLLEQRFSAGRCLSFLSITKTFSRTVNAASCRHRVKACPVSSPCAFLLISKLLANMLIIHCKKCSPYTVYNILCKCHCNKTLLSVNYHVLDLTLFFNQPM